jgi:hypothetical protein
MMGDTLARPAGAPVTFECEVDGARGHLLELIQDGRVIERRALEDETVRAVLAVPFEGPGYLRAQIVASGPAAAYPRLLALTNPIYIR